MFNNLDEPFVVNYDPSTRKKMKQYRAIFGLLSLLCIILLALLLCSVFLGFDPKQHTSRHERTITSYTNFFHLSDIHLDLFYSSNTSRRPSFCRDIYPNSLNITPATATFNAIFGRVGCDSPKTLFEASVDYMQQVSKSKNGIHFLVITGDQVAHNIDKGFITGTITERVLSTMSVILSSLSKKLPDIPIIPSFGNNDLLGDYKIPVNSSFYQKVLDIWAPVILCDKCKLKVTTASELSKTFLDGGYYRAEFSDEKTVFLMLNTNYWSVNGITKNPSQDVINVANRQIKWMEEELKVAKQKGNKVIINAHIPPGVDGFNGRQFWLTNYTSQYVKLVADTYKDVVIGQLYGHMHKDDFRVQMAQDNLNITDGKSSFALIGPGITPVYANNPAFRVVQLDAKRQLLVDYEQYYMDLVLSTANKQPLWQFDYKFSDKYLPSLPDEKKEISAKVIMDLSSKLIDPNDKNKVWNNYIQERQVHYQVSVQRYQLYCCARHVNHDVYNACVKKYNVMGG